MTQNFFEEFLPKQVWIPSETGLTARLIRAPTNHSSNFIVLPVNQPVQDEQDPASESDLQHVRRPYEQRAVDARSSPVHS